MSTEFKDTQTLIEYFSRFWLIQIIHAYINQHHNVSESLIINKYYNTIMFFDFHTVLVSVGLEKGSSLLVGLEKGSSLLDLSIGSLVVL